jgi:hypothetical protein
VAADPKPFIVDLLVLAFSKSALRETVTRDAITALDVATMLRGNVLSLEAVWRLAKSHPSFDQKSAAIPFCFFKQYDRRLGVIVELPADLKALSATEQTTNASLLPAKKEDVEQILAPLTATGRSTPLPGTMRAVSSSSPVSSSSSSSSSSTSSSSFSSSPVAKPSDADDAPKRRTGMAILGAVLLAGAAAFLGTTIMTNCRTAPKWQSLSADAFQGIPVSQVRMLGNQVEAVLTDPGWLAQPEDARRTELAATLSALKDRKIAVIAVKDSSKTVRASVQWSSGSPPQPIAKFY